MGYFLSLKVFEACEDAQVKWIVPNRNTKDAKTKAEYVSHYRGYYWLRCVKATLFQLTFKVSRVRALSDLISNQSVWWWSLSNPLFAASQHFDTSQFAHHHHHHRCTTLPNCQKCNFHLSSVKMNLSPRHHTRDTFLI